MLGKTCRVNIPGCAGGPARLSGRGLAIRLSWLVVSLSSISLATTPTLSLVVSSETAPSGAWAQIKVSLAAPQQVTGGYLSINFDPQVFGSVGNIAVFSATGDAQGFADVSGTHVDATFTSTSGGIGQVPDLPVFVVSVSILPGLTPGTATTVTVDPSGGAWSNLLGNPYQVASASATFTAGGTLSIQRVSPAGGIVAPGATVTVQGIGFDSATAATMDGVGLSSVQYVSQQQIGLTLESAVELTGRHLHLVNSSGEHIDYFLGPPSTPSVEPSSENVEPLMPLNTFQTVEWSFPIEQPLSDELFGLLNQNVSPVVATFFGISLLDSSLVVLQTYTIPPGELYFLDYASIIGGDSNTLWLTASAPIRMMAYESDFNNLVPGAFQKSTFPPSTVTSLPAYSFGYPANVTVQVTENWQIGTPPPADVPLTSNVCQGASVSVSSSAQSWLSVSVNANGSATASFNVSSLTPGVYSGTVTATCPAPAALAGLLRPNQPAQVTLTVTGLPLISLSPLNHPIAFTVTSWGAPPSPLVFQVQSSGAPAQFTVTTSTPTAGNWLSVTPSQGTSPSSLTVSVNAAGLATGTYQGQITVQGPANTVSMPATLYVFDEITDPGSVTFFLEAGSAATNTEVVQDNQGTVSSVSVSTQSGGGWLTAVIDQGPEVDITASAVNLGPGTYYGIVTIASAAGSPTSVPVTLTVLGQPASALAVAPASFSLAATAYQTVTQSVTVNSSGEPALFSFTGSIAGSSVAGSTVAVSGISSYTSTGSYVTPGALTSDGGNSALTPATLQLTMTGSQPGTYYGSVVVTWDGGSVTIPITFSVTAAPGSLPLVATVLNGASQTAGPLAPGEVISIFGQGIGPAPQGLVIASGKVATTLGDTQVLIGGVPAPLLYASTSQVNAVVPYEVGASETATLQLVSNGQQSPVWQLPVAPSSPALFTSNSSGLGQAAALNQNNSINGASSPAARGEVIQLWGTGGGQTSPPDITGGIEGPSGNPTVLPVTVTIGGVEAVTLYFGSAPQEIAGVLQVNAVIPLTLAQGIAVPVVVTVGGRSSQQGLTVAIQ